MLCSDFDSVNVILWRTWQFHTKQTWTPDVQLQIPGMISVLQL